MPASSSIPANKTHPVDCLEPLCHKGTIFVPSGEVWATAQKIILRADGIGSCIVVAAYDIPRRIGSLAHIMLPGSPPSRSLTCNTKYAHDAINDMLFKLTRFGAGTNGLEACLVGGGNVLNDKNDTICAAILNSVTTILGEKGIRIMAQAVGGTIRRWAALDIETGAVQYTEGDSEIKLLYRWGA